MHMTEKVVASKNGRKEEKNGVIILNESTENSIGQTSPLVVPTVPLTDSPNTGQRKRFFTKQLRCLVCFDRL